MGGARSGGILAPAAFAAGCAGLAHEVVWSRAFAPALGTSTRAAALVLAAIGGGYGLGARLAERSGPAGARRLLLLSSAIVAGGGLVLPGIGLALARPDGFGATAPLGVLLPLAVALLALPSAAMGAFGASLFRLLPASAGARPAGIVVASNAAGAALGAMAAGWAGGIGAFGLRGCAAAASALYLAAGALALVARGDADGAPLPPQESSTRRPEERSGATVLAALFAVGLATLGLQVVATRATVVFLEGFTPHYAAVLAFAFVGLAIGAGLVSAARPVRARPGALAAVLLASAAAFGLVANAPSFVPFVDALASPGGPAEHRLASLAIPALFTLPAAIPLGAAFPVCFSLLAGSAGRRGALALAAVSTGGAAGPLLVGLFLLPRFGARGAAACLALALACVAVPFLRGGILRVALPVAALLPLAGPSLRRPLVSFSPAVSPPEVEILEAREDAPFAVAVLDDAREGERTLLTDAFRAAGTSEEYRYMRALGHLPALVHGRPRRACVIGLGTGTTAGALALHAGIERLVVVEISPAVLAFAPYFRAVNSPLFPEGRLDPRASLRVDDGRRHLLGTAERFDLITLEPLLPYTPAAIHFYTTEFYALARARLAPAGLVCQWVPAHALRRDETESLLATFARSFPASAVFLVGPSLVLVGGEAIPEPLPRVPASGGELLADLREVDLDPPDALERWLVIRDGRGLASLGAPTLADERPFLEFFPVRTPAAKLAYLRDNLRFVLERFDAAPAERPDLRRRLLEARIADAEEDLAERGLLAGRAPLDAAAAYERVRAEWGGSRLVAGFRARLLWRRGYRHGYDALRRGETAAAAERLAQAVEAMPYRFETRLAFAAALARAGRVEGARLQAARAFALVPRLLETREWRGADREATREPLLAAPGLLADAERLARAAAAGAGAGGTDPLRALEADDPAPRLAAFRALARDPRLRRDLPDRLRPRLLGWTKTYGWGDGPVW